MFKRLSSWTTRSQRYPPAKQPRLAMSKFVNECFHPPETQDEDIEEDAPAEDPNDDGLVPISYFALPSTVLTDLALAWKVRHIIDYTPSPQGVIAKVVEMGMSYFGFCATDHMKKFLTDQVLSDLKISICSPSSKLYDRRLAATTSTIPATVFWGATEA